jgi:hypothetical protein
LTLFPFLLSHSFPQPSAIVTHMQEALINSQSQIKFREFRGSSVLKQQEGGKESNPQLFACL